MSGCPLALHVAALLFVLPCHRFDPVSACIYTSLSRWERLFQKHSPCMFLEYFLQNQNNRHGVGPARVFLEDLTYLGT